MILERIVISDTNILFDLMAIELLDSFFRMPWEVLTTDFVMDEIKQLEQKQHVNKFVVSNKLKVIQNESIELSEIFTLFRVNRNNASIADCSVWHLAKKRNARLLTGDAKLRKSAEADSVKVSGVLFIFDCLVDYGIEDKKTCAVKLMDLMKINSRLPKSECMKRIESWLK